MDTLKFTIIKSQDQYDKYCEMLENLLVNDDKKYFDEIELLTLLIEKWDSEQNTFNDMESYNVIIKTYWLRLIQRHWRKIYKQRFSIITQRIKPINQQYKSIHGNYPSQISNLPSLSGMLSMYQNSLDTTND